jgi:regulator of replication initiation timing
MSILENARDALSLVQKLGNLELYKQLLDLNKELVDVVQENMTLHTRVKELEDSLSIKDALVFRDNHYWLPAPEGEPDGPFCQVCWDVDRRLVRMFHDTYYSCTYCAQHRPRF